MKTSLKSILLSSLLFSSMSIFANTPELAGKWRSIDDKTGFSKAIIEIKKSDEGIYTGKIIEILARPGYVPKTVCDKCKGTDKNKAILGLEVLRDMKQSSKNPLEYEGGTILDPLNGNLYKSKIRLNNSGSRISMRGYIGIEVVGRSQTWIRHQ